MENPFKVGDRIKSIFSPIGTVTELTERGFKYEYDEPWHVHPRLGITYTGGECYETGFHLYRLENDEDSKKIEFHIRSI